MVHKILSETSTSISEFKKNPMAVIEEGEGFPIAVLNHNQPAFYCIPAKAYEALIDKLEDIELAQLVLEREGGMEVEVDIDEL